MQRKPFCDERSNGSRASASQNMYCGSFQPPPRMNRMSPPVSVQHHSFPLPAMSKVPLGPIPWYLPTGAGPVREKLLATATNAEALGSPALYQWYSVGKLLPAYSA